jgi:hypothetical protein
MLLKGESRLSLRYNRERHREICARGRVCLRGVEKCQEALCKERDKIKPAYIPPGVYARVIVVAGVLLMTLFVGLT